MSRGHKCIRGHNDLSTEFESADSDFQRHSRIAHADAMFDDCNFDDFVFEFLNHRTVVREPPPIEDFLEPLHEPGLVTKVRSTHVKFLRETRCSTEDRQIRWFIATCTVCPARGSSRGSR